MLEGGAKAWQWEGASSFPRSPIERQESSRPGDPAHGPAATRRLCEIRLVDDFLYPMVRARAVSLAESVHSAKSQRNCLSRIEMVRSSHRTEIRSCPLTRRALNSSSIAGLSCKRAYAYNILQYHRQIGRNHG